MTQEFPVTVEYVEVADAHIYSLMVDGQLVVWSRSDRKTSPALALIHLLKAVSNLDV